MVQFLGSTSNYGEYVEKDEVEAMKLIRKSADQNYAPAQRTLGDCYQYGKGVTKNEVEAVRWFRKAAEQGNARAQSTLGYCCMKGRGVAVDYVEATKWLRRAVNQEGHSDDLYWLGCCYESTKDFVEAYKCWELCGEGDHFDLEKLMTPDQIAEAKRLARQFKLQKESASGNSSST